MKKIWIILTILTFCGCRVEKQDIPEVLPKEEIREVYKDENPVVLGMYDENNKLINSYESKWQKKKDIVWPTIFPTNELKLPKEKTKNTWIKYWEGYKDKGYKFGLETSYKTNENIDLSIFKFSDNIYFKYVEIYLYDSYNTNASWISHLEDKDFNDKTVFTSVKITAGELIDEVTSPIKLKVFTYDTEDDFDELGKYRGNSYYEFIINNDSI